MQVDHYYGFSFDKVSGIGACLHAILLAVSYARRNGIQFAFPHDMQCAYLNGKPNDKEINLAEATNFHSYFSCFPVTQGNLIAIWPDPVQIPNPVEFIPNDAFNHYALLMQEIYQLHHHVQEQVNQRIESSGFNPTTDLVVHIRRGDKLHGNNIEEYGELPLSEYVESTVSIIQSVHPDRTDLRVFLCTDDTGIFDQVSRLFQEHKISVIRDVNETHGLIQGDRVNGTISHDIAQDDNITALKNIGIMSRSIHLIGGRMSYLFRIAELLRGANKQPTYNLKDSDKFGIAPYTSLQTKYLINPFHKRRYHDFVSHELLLFPANKCELFTYYSDTLERDFIITIPDFMSNTIKDTISLCDFEWWVHAIRPNVNGYEPMYFNTNNGDTSYKEHAVVAGTAADTGQFAYHFKRSIGKHYNTCLCTVCRLEETFSSYEVMKTLSKIVGKRVTHMTEMFASAYERDHYLTMHHDKQKGDYTFILSLTKDWKPAFGGITHFCNESGSTIEKSITPKFNVLTIFKLDPSRIMNHFVSRVCAPETRYAFTGWFNVEK